MKKSTLMILLLTVFVLVLGVAVVAADDTSSKPGPDVSTEALRAPGSNENVGGGVITTDFEAPAFSPGACGGQNGWTMFVASTTEGHIDTVNPAGGTQNLRISKDSANGTGTTTGCFSPDLGAMPLGHYTVSVDVAIGDIGGADYDVVPQAPSQAFLTARVKFYFEGDILILDDTGGGLAFVDTGFDWVPGDYKNLTIDIDSNANTIDYYYDGTLIYSSVAGVYAGISVEQVVILSDNWQAGESGDFDNLVVEHPTAVGLNDLSGSNATTMLPLAVAALLGFLSIAVVVGSKRNKQTI